MFSENIHNIGINGEILGGKELEARRNAFQANGFSEKWIDALQKRKPVLYSSTTLTNHLHGLKQRGFANPRRIIETFSTTLDYTFDNVDRKLAGLEKRGFKNPCRLIELSPSILGLSLNNIDSKLRGLEQQGFINPQKLIESHPPILGYTLNNINKRIKLLNRLVALYQLPFTAQELMTNQKALFSAKVDKIIILTRVIRRTSKSCHEITNPILNQFLFSNLEDVLLAVDSFNKAEAVSPRKVLQRAREIKACNLSRDEKRERIVFGMDSDPKLKRRYIQGYPNSSSPTK